MSFFTSLFKHPTKPIATLPAVLPRVEFHDGTPFIHASPYAFFTVEQSLGSGQFAAVFRVRPLIDAASHLPIPALLSGDRTYALKRIRKAYMHMHVHMRSTSTSEAVLTEVRILSKLRGHPHVAQLHAVFEDEHCFYLVLEESLGGELFAAIAERGASRSAFTEREAAAVLRVVLSTLSDLHTLHIAHRDIKPENLLLATPVQGGVVRAAELKLIDFGLAREFMVRNPSQLDPDGPGLPVRTGSLVGSVYYLSPEVVMRDYLGPEADVWACGVLLHILLVGEPPFLGSTSTRSDSDVEPDASPRASDRLILDQILFQRLDFRGPRFAGVSAGAIDLVSKLLDRNTSRRLTARQALDHPWLRPSPSLSLVVYPVLDHDGYMSGRPSPSVHRAELEPSECNACNRSPGPGPLLHTIAERLVQTATREEEEGNALSGRLRRLFLHYCAALHLPRELDIAPLRDLFVQLDGNGDGYLDVAELLTAFACHPHTRALMDRYPGALTAALRRLSLPTPDRGICFEALLSAVLDGADDAAGGLDEWTLRNAFASMDVRSDGFLEASELAESFRTIGLAKPDLTLYKKMIHAHDRDGDGKLSLAEFLCVMRGEGAAEHPTERNLGREESWVMLSPTKSERMETGREAVAAAEGRSRFDVLPPR